MCNTGLYRLQMFDFYIFLSVSFMNIEYLLYIRMYASLTIFNYLSAYID